MLRFRIRRLPSTLGGVERIQKILSQAGVASRRTAEELMLQGRVTVNGDVVRELGTKADPATDDIRVDGRRVKQAERPRYVLLYKPAGYVTTRSDPQRRSTVMDLIPGVREYVYPVGRLDYDTEGLLLLTNDGDLAARLTHPRHEVPRVYEVTVAGVPDAHDIERIAKGVTIEGRRTEPARVELAPGRHTATATLRITIAEGRNRQVRKMFEAVGHPVDSLKRVSIGPLRDARIKPGQWRDLTADEVRALKKAVAREPSGDGRAGKRDSRATSAGRETREAAPRRPARPRASAPRQGRPAGKPRGRR